MSVPALETWSGDQPPPNLRALDESVPDEDVHNDDDVFWDARPELGHLRDFARARRAAPWAVLGCALVHAAARIEPFVVLPPIIGGHASLNLFLGLVGPSGGGKGAAESAARDAIAYDRDVVEAGVGSGEGLAHTYLRYVPGKNGEKGTVEQHTTRAVFRAAEVDTLAALKGRQGSTLLPKLRDAWLGDSLGFAYADQSRRLDLRPHTYRMGLIVGIQPGRAAVLLDDTDGGTPQRFLWLPTRDPNIPDQRPREPPRRTWQHPQIGAADGWTSRVTIPVCPTATDAIDQAAIDRHHGRVDALDGHALMCRLKTAAALALLNGRTNVDDHDWHLAGTVMRISDTTRAAVVHTLTATHRARTAAAGRAEGERAVAAEQVKTNAAAQRVSRLLLSKLTTDWTPGAALRKQLPSRDRDHFDDAIARLHDSGLLDTNSVEYRGTEGAHYRRKGAPRADHP